MAALESLGVKVSQRLPLVVAATKDARAYLRTKALRMAHVLPPESYATAAEANAAAEAIAAADSLAAAAEALAHAGGGGSAPSETPGASSQSTINDAKADGAAETFVNPQDGKVHTWALGRASAEAAIAAVARGELVAVTDDEVYSYMPLNSGNCLRLPGAFYSIQFFSGTFLQYSCSPSLSSLPSSLFLFVFLPRECGCKNSPGKTKAT